MKNSPLYLIGALATGCCFAQTATHQKLPVESCNHSKVLSAKDCEYTHAVFAILGDSSLERIYHDEAQIISLKIPSDRAVAPTKQHDSKKDSVKDLAAYLKGKNLLMKIDNHQFVISDIQVSNENNAFSGKLDERADADIDMTKMSASLMMAMNKDTSCFDIHVIENTKDGKLYKLVKDLAGNLYLLPSPDGQRINGYVSL